MDLGKLRIETTYFGNLIQVFNSPQICSLVINGNVVDTYEGLVAVTFRLRGTIETPNGQKNITVNMSLSATMRIYCDKIQLAKKWLPFG